jgi:hypothetical protein
MVPSSIVSPSRGNFTSIAIAGLSTCKIITHLNAANVAHFNSTNNQKAKGGTQKNILPSGKLGIAVAGEK